MVSAFKVKNWLLLFNLSGDGCWQMLGLVMQLQKKKGGAKGKSKPPTRSTRVHTFFDFFSPPVVPESESELTETQMDALQSALEKDYELGCATYTHSNTHSSMLVCCFRQLDLFIVCMKHHSEASLSPLAQH